MKLKRRSLAGRIAYAPGMFILSYRLYRNRGCAARLSLYCAWLGVRSLFDALQPRRVVEPERG